MSQPIYRVTVFGPTGVDMVSHEVPDLEQAHRLAETLAETLAERCPAGGSVYVFKVLSIYTLAPKRQDLP